MDKDTVRRVAGLARIRMTDGEIDYYAGKMAGIMKFVEQLNEVNTQGVEPLPSPVDIPLPLRRDAVTDGDIQQDVLANGAETLEGFYVVPKVVE